MLFYSSALFAGEYLISYRYTIHNTILTNEELFISKTMTKCLGSPSHPLIFPSKKTDSIKKTILLNKERFVEYLEDIGVEIQAHSLSTNTQTQSSISITCKTQCFEITPFDGYIKISHLQSRF